MTEEERQQLEAAVLKNLLQPAEYEIDGERTTDFPMGDRLDRAKPVYEYVEGFKTDISGCKKKSELPKAALDYIKYVEKAIGCPIKYVSVGASRDQYIVM